MWKRIAQFTGGFIIAAAGLAIFFRDVKIDNLLPELRATPVLVLILVTLLSPVSLYFRAMRWRLILPFRASATNNDLFRNISIGFMVNNILPARMGEAARAFILWRRNKFTVAESIGSLVVERVIDTFVFSSFFFVPVLFRQEFVKLQPYAIVFAAGFGAFIVGLIIYALAPGRVRKLLNMALAILPKRFRIKGEAALTDVLSNLNWVFSIRRTGSVIVLSYLATMCYPLMLYLLAGQPGTFDFLDSMIGQSFAALGAAIPLSPGYVGTLHAALLSGLTLIGLDPQKAGAVTIIYHALSFIIITVMGLVFFFTTNISMREIGQAQRTMQDSRERVPAADSPA
jgi:glycosyltransferase 2 family protein